MKKLEDSYPNPPLIEVAFELKFPTQLSLQYRLGEFQKLISSIYPVAQEGDILIEAVSDLGEIFKQKKRPYWQFSNKKRSSLIRITSNTFGIITKQYSNFDDQRNLIIEAVEIFKEILEDLKFPINRIGLRYINHCEFPNNDKNQFKDYFYFPFREFIGNGIPEMRNFTLNIKSDMNKIGLTTNLGMFSKRNKENDYFYLIDIDTFILNDLTIDTDIEQKLIQLHDLAKKTFRSHITDEFINKVMKRTD